MRGSSRIILIACVLASADVTSAQSNDSILSRHVREADGTSGQDTNSGAGIKTGHIQNAAVTAPKLAAGAVGAAAIVDGAVTDAKITGPISASKISTTGLNADTVDGVHAAFFAPATHNHDSTYARRYARVLVVSGDGRGDFLDPSAAMASIVDASEANPYLIKVLPGVFGIGSSPIEMKAYVDLEGSGRDVTRIVLTSNGTASGGVLRFRSSIPSQVRHVSLENRASGTYSQTYSVDGPAVTIQDGGAAHLADVRLVSIDAVNGVGLHSNAGGECILRNVEILVQETHDLSAVVGTPTSKFGVWAWGGAVMLDGVSVEVTGGDTSAGLFLEGYHAVVVRNSVIRADQYGAQVGPLAEGTTTPFEPVRSHHSSFKGSACGVRANSPYAASAVFLGHGLEIDGAICRVTTTPVRIVNSVDGLFAPLQDIVN